MIETNISNRTRDAYRAAHQARGDAFADMVRRIFNRQR